MTWPEKPETGCEDLHQGFSAQVDTGCPSNASREGDPPARIAQHAGRCSQGLQATNCWWAPTILGDSVRPYATIDLQSLLVSIKGQWKLVSGIHCKYALSECLPLMGNNVRSEPCLVGATVRDLSKVNGFVAPWQLRLAGRASLNCSSTCQTAILQGQHIPLCGNKRFCMILLW